MASPGVVRSQNMDGGSPEVPAAMAAVDGGAPCGVYMGIDVGFGIGSGTGSAGGAPDAPCVEWTSREQGLTAVWEIGHRIDFVPAIVAKT